MVISILVSLLFVSDWRLPFGQEWLPVIGIGILGLIGQIFVTQAFQTEETSVLAPFKYMELVWALIIGYLFLSETHDWIPFMGIILILSGMIMNVYGKEKS